MEIAALLVRRWFGPDADPWDVDLQAGALLLDKRETDRLQVAVQNAISRTIRFK
jgi:hypothetical protein